MLPALSLQQTATFIHYIKTNPLFFLCLTPHLGSLPVGTARPLAQSLLAPSLPRAMENFCDFLTFLQLFGSEEGAGAAHKHVYV